MRAVRRAAIAALLALALSACGDSALKPDAALVAALESTSKRPRVLVYEEKSGGSLLRIDVRHQDDLRYSADLARDGRTVQRVVVSDDAVALQLLGGGAQQQLSPSAQTSARLRAGGWVRDETGAPSPLALATQDAAPLRDALAVLGYVATAVRAATGVVPFNPDAIGYVAEEDPFRQPAADEQRFDLLPEPLLPGDEEGNLPTLEDLREMAIYVAPDGSVREVQERVGAFGQLDRILRNYSMPTPEGSSREQLAELALARVNEERKKSSQPPITARTLSVRVSGLGSAIPVTLPVDAAAGLLTQIPGLGPTGRSATS